MNVVAAAFALAPALAVGGFLDVVVKRVPAGRSVVRPRSSCDACSTELRWHDTVPLFSYLVLHGRCRHCRAPISALTPAVEAVTAAVIVGCVAVLGPTVGAALASGAGMLVVAAAAIGLQRRS